MKKVIILLLAVLLILGSGMCGDALGNAMAEGPEETVRLTYYKSVRIRTGDTLWGSCRAVCARYRFNNRTICRKAPSDEFFKR